jgi:ferredoxin
VRSGWDARATVDRGTAADRSTIDEGPSMKVTVDYDLCASTGACMQTAPEVFEVRSDGFLYVLQEEPGEELRTKVIEASEVCPTGAITIEG